MIWGETGARKGATNFQVASVGWLWSRYGITELHNGDCIGADVQLYYLAYAFRAKVVIHPPTNYEYRAWLADTCDRQMPERDYHQRDEDIVNESDLLVACVLKPVEIVNSGTWYTINYARSINRPIAIVWPNGHITYENWSEGDNGKVNYPS